MTEGKHYTEFEIVKGSSNRNDGWCFGVCRPEINLGDIGGNTFHQRDDTWMMFQSNLPCWTLSCNSNWGNFVRDSIDRKLNAGDRVGLLLDLDNGGTLTLYVDGMPCGTIAERLAGPLHWCIVSYWAGKAVRIYSNLPLPRA